MERMLRLRLIAAALLLVLLAGIVFFVLRTSPDEAVEQTSIMVLCGAGIRPPIADIAAAFQRRRGIRVEVHYGPSNVLLGQLEVTRRGDVFLPGDDWYISEAEAKGLVGSGTKVAYFVPVILTARDNPHAIQSLRDLAQEGLRLGFADARSAAIGRITEQILVTNDLDMERIRANQVYTSITADELGTAIQLGHVDAVIVWDAVANYYRESSTIIPIPAEQNIITTIAAAVTLDSAVPEAAREFIEFLSSPYAVDVFRQHGYQLE